jgi:integrase
MSLVKKDKYWWVDIRINGKRYRQSTGKRQKGDALEQYQTIIEEIRRKTAPSQPVREDKKFTHLVERYMNEHSKIHKTPKSSIRDESSFKHLSAYFHDEPLSEITSGTIADYKASRRSAQGKKAGKKIAPATIARELELLRHALNLAEEWEWIVRAPKIRIERVHNKIERWLTAEEEKRLLEVSPSWLRDIIIFALNTGMREDEILSLKWPQVDGTRRTVTVLYSKNKEKRTIPINKTVLAILTERFKPNNPVGYVFPAESGEKLDARNLLRAYYIARKKALLEDVRFHDLRHTFATRLVQSGVDLYVVKELLGHKTITMTMRYAHHYPESLRHGVDLLDSFGQKNTQSGHIVDTLGKKERATETVTL